MGSFDSFRVPWIYYRLKGDWGLLLIDQKNRDHTTRSRFAAVVLVAVVALAGSFATYAQSHAVPPFTTLSTATPTSLAQVNGSEFPNVVAYVDGNPITGQQLTREIYILQHTAGVVVGQSSVTQVALQQIIEDMILIDHASDYGIAISMDQARAYAQQQRTFALNNPATRQSISLLAQQLGVSVEAYFSQPQVIDGYRKLMTLKAMQGAILSTLPADQRANSANEQAALAAFAAGIHARVEVLITVP